jgi:hypothetical protein
MFTLGGGEFLRGEPYGAPPLTVPSFVPTLHRKQ